MWGNFSSMTDPYFVMRAYHSRYVLPTGQSGEQYWRWSNAEYDELVEQMARTSTADELQMADLFRKMASIWLRELPSIPLVQWPHRIPHNQTYWTNWPSQENPYINSAYWSRTWLLVLLNLQPTEA
jgi:peptide/nickel transport system substrate-binding protein